MEHAWTKVLILSTSLELLHSETLSFAIDVAQTQVDVGPDALHGLDGQRTSQVLGVGPGRREAETKAAEGEDGGKPEWLLPNP